MSKKTILITAASGEGFPSFGRYLKRLGKEFRIVGVSPDKEAAGFTFIDKGYFVSQPEDKNYIRDLLTVCKKEKVKILIPSDPKELVLLAGNKNKFEKIGTLVLSSSLESVRTAEDKEKFFMFCKEKGIPVPDFIKVKNYKDFRKAVFQLGYPEKVVCFKPIISSGTRGFRVLSSKNDRLHNLLKDHPGGVMADFSEVCSILKTAEYFPEILVMEFLPGKEYTVDVLADNGKTQIIIPRTRDKVLLGASFLGRAVEEKEVIEYSKRIVEGLNLDAIVGIQFKKDEKDVPKAIEVNPRIQGATLLSVAAGVDLIDLAIKNALGKSWKKPKIKWGTRMIRYFDEIYQDEKGKFFKI
ncbi:MAG: ATP-grasp domain-containing protein [Patescibacteria group bacterium]